MEDDWDLQAVVRGCSTAAAAAKAAAAAAAASSGFFSDHHFHQSRPSLISSFGQQGVVASGQPFSVLAPNPDPIKPRNAAVELDDLYKPFFTKSQSHYVPSPPTPIPQLSPLPQITPPNFSSPQPHPKHQHHHNHHHQQQQQSKLSVTNPQRSKKRKNLLKKVCTVPAESLSSDIWAWRKYGQKPIKGSPYPRGYYRCSSSKGCMARKQVERHRSEPGMFIVTYTAEHNHPAPTHRNSLAGSTRHKPISSSVTGGDSIKAAAKVLSPSPSTSPSMEDELFATAAVEIKHGKQSPLADETEIEYFGSCDTIVSDDFFVGLDGLAGDYFSDHSPENFDLPFYTSAAATTSI